MTENGQDPVPEVLTGPTAELTFLGPSHDGSRLLLASADGARFELPVDQRLIAVVSREHSQRPIQTQRDQTDPLSPREIQDRIRHGETAEDLAKSHGVAIEQISRFANPVITERAHVAAQAQSVLVEIDGDQVELVEAVTRRLSTRGIDAHSTLWDAWRRNDGEWTVVVAYPITQGTQVATFMYSPQGRFVTAIDDEARWLLEQGPDKAPTQPSPPAPTQTPSDGERPQRWDREHPAARAAQRRESATTQTPEYREEVPNQVRDEASAPAQRQERHTSPSTKQNPNDHWEELLFGTSNDD